MWMAPYSSTYYVYPYASEAFFRRGKQLLFQHVSVGFWLPHSVLVHWVLYQEFAANLCEFWRIFLSVSSDCDVMWIACVYVCMCVCMCVCMYVCVCIIS